MTLPSLTKDRTGVWQDGVATDKDDVRQWGLEVETALNALFSRTPLINGYITVTAAANVLTVAIKTRAGADPSSTDPVYVDFRNATESSGADAVLSITSAVSMTVAATATLGLTSNEEGRVWVVLFNDGGTPRLGVFNAFGSTPGTVHGLLPGILTSTTAEGGDGSADSAGVIYTGTAVTSKPFVVLGHATWETPMATAGNWATPDVVYQQRWGDPMPGDVVQKIVDRDSGVTTVTDTIPLDDTIPQQSSEGDQLMSAAIVPKSGANLLEVRAEAAVGGSADSALIIALFQDATANALCARSSDVGAAAETYVIPLEFYVKAGQQTSTTFKLFGGPTTGTMTFNGSGGSRTFGGVNWSHLSVSEIMS